METPDRFARIKHLFQTASDLEPEKQIAFLDEACDGDDELRREVEILLEQEARAKPFLEIPALEIEARAIAHQNVARTEGQFIGRYRVVREIGKGGMGEVYLAWDIRLDRQVALKLLPTHASDDRDRHRRFEREARAVAALNHPNIVTIYDIGESDDIHFIATEFIEGQTLRQRLSDGPLSPAETLKIAIQIASALDASALCFCSRISAACRMSFTRSSRESNLT